MSWNHVKAATSFFYSEKSFVKKRSKQQQFACCSYHCTQPLVQNFTITCLWSEFSAQHFFCRNWLFSPILHESTYKYNETHDSPHGPSKLAFFRGPEIEFLRNCGNIFKETVSFDDIEQSNDEENIVTYVDYVCGFNIYSEAPTEVNHINPERKNLSRSCEKPICFPANDPNHQMLYRRRAYLYYFSEPVHYVEQGSSSSYDTQQHYR